MMGDGIMREKYTYTVSISTSNAPMGGTDAKIFLKILGSFGSWETNDLEAYVKPHVHRDPFERDQTDSFPIEVEGGFFIVNALEIAVHHCYSGSWYVSQVVITGENTETGEIVSWESHPNRMISDDGEYVYFTVYPT